jgi:hypothetical protein
LVRKGERAMNIRPLLDRILVKRIEEEEKTEGGIIIPDTAKEEYTDLMKAGIIDPTKVVRLALQNAASVASLMDYHPGYGSGEAGEESTHAAHASGRRDVLTAVDREIENEMPKAGVVSMLPPFSHHFRYTINTKRELQRDFLHYGDSKTVKKVDLGAIIG